MLSQANLCRLFLLLKFALGEFGLLVERVDHLAEELVVRDAALGPILDIGLRVLEERVEFLVFGRLVGRLQRRHGRLCVVPQHVEFKQACK